MIKSKNAGSPVSIGFLLVPNFSMLAFSSSVEPLRMANQLSGKTLYEWFTVGADEHPVTATNNIVITPDIPIEKANNLDALFVCSGNQVQHHTNPGVLSWDKSGGKTGYGARSGLYWHLCVGKSGCTGWVSMYHPLGKHGQLARGVSTFGNFSGAI